MILHKMKISQLLIPALCGILLSSVSCSKDDTIDNSEPIALEEDVLDADLKTYTFHYGDQTFGKKYDTDAAQKQLLETKHWALSVEDNEVLLFDKEIEVENFTADISKFDQRTRVLTLFKGRNGTGQSVRLNMPFNNFSGFDFPNSFDNKAQSYKTFTRTAGNVAFVRNVIFYDQKGRRNEIQRGPSNSNGAARGINFNASSYNMK